MQKKKKKSVKVRATEREAPATTARQFADLSTRILDAAQRFLGVRNLRASHPELREEVERRLPARLRQPLVDYEAASSAASDARYRVQLAERGGWLKGTPEGKRSLAAAQKSRDRAEARAKQAGKAADAIQLARVQAEETFVRKWLRKHGGVFVKMRAHYAVAFAEREHDLAALDRAPARVGDWSGTSHCDLLRQVTDALVRLIEHDEKGADYFPGIRLARSLNAIDRGALEMLRIAVRKEVATAACPAPTTAPTPRKQRVAERVVAELARWTAEGRWDGTQKALAEAVQCSTRQLRRGRAKSAWQAYLASGRRDAVVPMSPADEAIERVDSKRRG